VGASTSDVALALAADPRVSAELRGQVADAMGVAGYQPLHAVQAALGRPPRVAIVLKAAHLEDNEANRFYHPVASALAQALLSHGAEVVATSAPTDDRYRLTGLPSEVTDGQCDAALVVGAQLDDAGLEMVGAAATPTILVDGYSMGDALDSVVTSNAAGAQMAVDYLMAAGHTEIALIGTEPTSYPSMRERRAGYLRAITDEGLLPHFIDTSYTLSDADAVLGIDYLKQHPEVTAMIGANDLICIALMRRGRDEGIRFPADVSLVGFDDIDLAGLVVPALTTMAIDKPMMGRAGFALLVHRLECPDAGPVTAMVAARLIERETVAPPTPRREAGNA
jgi:DNA-binding LacI/PurR family transcriptional regulator